MTTGDTHNCERSDHCLHDGTAVGSLWCCKCHEYILSMAERLGFYEKVNKIPSIRAVREQSEVGGKMNKQEEIREGIESTLKEMVWGEHNWSNITKSVIQYLHSQGVVIKVDPPYTLYKDTPLTAYESLVVEG